MNAIFKRQSIRKYTNQKVTHEQLVKLMEAAFRAPTARNKQPWKFLVIEDVNRVQKIANFHPNYNPFKTAQAAIIVMYDQEIEDRECFGYVDTAAAIENILLEACDMGLGTCWCAIAPLSDRSQCFIDEFNIKENICPVGAISIGYPDEVKQLEERYDDAKITWIK